jgi:hypothetical protein
MSNYSKIDLCKQGKTLKKHHQRKAIYMKRIFQTILLLCMGFALMTTVGCATSSRMVTGGQKTLINSEPSGAELFLNGEHAGRTPQIVALSPRKEYRVRIELSGYQSYSTISSPSVDFLGGASMYAGDTALVAISPIAGAAAYGVDFLTKQSKAHPKEITAKLLPMQFGTFVGNPLAQRPPPPPSANTAQPPPPPVPDRAVYRAPPPAYVPPPQDPSHNLPAARNDK